MMDFKPRPGMSPTGRYMVMTRATVAGPPETVLLNREGEEQLLLERSDVSALPPNWQWPEPVMLTAADNTTPIYGVVFRPSDFSPEKSYPVLDYTAGHLEQTSAFRQCIGSEGYLSAAAWAELGFIVVKFNPRGGDLRGRDFHDQVPKTIPKCLKADCVAGIQQLGERYAWMDTTRVGVVDPCYYPQALTAMFMHPEFYQVGVSLHPVDGRLMGAFYRHWQHHAPLEDFAHRLQGKLLLTHGMLDEAISVAGTLRVVEALHQANKDFDMLLLPNGLYEGSDYVLRRSWDYLVTHLLGEQPPKNFALCLRES
jgi:dipeptidyl aminopeptidase/acylaminoacyl peptidase